MGLSELAEKLAKYRARLEAGQTKKIKPEHVDKVIRKLTDKRESLAEDMGRRSSGQDRALLGRRLAKVDDLIEQARWLRDEIDD